MLSLKAKISLFQVVVGFFINRLMKGIDSEEKKVVKNVQKVTDAEVALDELKADMNLKNSTSEDRIDTAVKYVNNLKNLL